MLQEPQQDVKPCPFCAGPAALAQGSQVVAVRCADCGASTRVFRFGGRRSALENALDHASAEQRAVGAWNMRGS